MGILVSILILAPVFEPLSLGALEGGWTAGVRLDNLLSTSTYLSKQTSIYEEDTYEYLNTQQSVSFGFPSEFSLLWRFKNTFALGIQGSANYNYSPDIEYKSIYCEGEMRREGKYKDKRWSGFVGPELYKYFYGGKVLSPYITVFPNFSINHSTHDDKGTRYSESDTVSYHCNSILDRKSWEIDFNFGVEYFFRLWNIQLGVRAKTALAGISRNYYESTYFYVEGDIEENRRESSENNYRLNFYLPTEGSLSLWLCCYS